jgi:PAS domain S-box-containing protein
MYVPKWLQPSKEKSIDDLETVSKKIWKPRPIDKEHTFSNSDILVSKTDSKGRITYVNTGFVEISGYTQEELLKKPHNVVRHAKMPSTIFKIMWDYIKSGKEINAYVINLSKDGGYYWVFANVTPSYDRERNVIGYHSTRRFPSEKGLKFIKPFYEEMRKLERLGGLHYGLNYFQEEIAKTGLSYEEFIYSLQN